MLVFVWVNSLEVSLQKPVTLINVYSLELPGEEMKILRHLGRVLVEVFAMSK
jgi:hypothetical protein